jgi:hypothetical protein
MYHNRVDGPSMVVENMLRFDPDQFKAHEAQLADLIDDIFNKNHVNSF